MKAAIGLGNPGPRYSKTRHNVGFEVIETVYRDDSKGRLDFEVKKFAFSGPELALVSESPKGLLVMPQLYMNNSGPTVKAVCRHYRLETGDILVVCDDVNLACGQIRLRKGGSSGGQKGLESVIGAFASEDVPRLRVGIGPAKPVRDLAAFVLGPFEKDEQALIKEAIARAAEAVRCWFESGTEDAMNRYNVKTSE